MSDATPEPTSGRRARTTKPEVIEDAVVVDEATGTEVEVETVHASATEPVVASTDAASTQTSTGVAPAANPVVAPSAGPQVVYVQAPPAPKKLGNRGFGVLVALLSSVLFALLLGVSTAALEIFINGQARFGFFARVEFYIPVLFFLIAFVILVLLANRANWWAYIVGSIFVAVVVYFGSIGLILLSSGVILNTPAEAAARFSALLVNPVIIIATILAREVSLWLGSAVSRRGRKLKVRNAEARTAYDRELVEKRSAHAAAAV